MERLWGFAMTQDIHLAFDHPSARSEATAGPDPLDRISVRDHVVEVDIGAFQAERGTTQRICFNIVVEVRPHDAAQTDDVDAILSYDRVTEAITDELAAERVNLLETLAERVAENILRQPQAMRVFVRIEKLDRGPGALGVEIVRSRAQAGPQLEAVEAALTPLIVFLSAKAIASDTLSGWLDDWEQTGQPVILSVMPIEMTLPEAAHPLAQRRIDLLALEQTAWVLAARDKRCVVVGSRTELDWSMKNGQMAVWAPSKMVLDAVDGPSNADPVELLLWLATELNAEDVLCVDTPELPGFDSRARYQTL